MRPALLLLVLAVAGAAAATPPAPGAARADAKPWFCHDLECPAFTTVRNVSAEVQQRTYEPAKWVSTVVKGVKYDKAVATGFWRLFKYISGNNEQQQKVEMTAPVTVRVIPSQGPFCEDDFQISFYVPAAFQAAPPTPSQEEVFIEERPAFSAYVAAFGGWATGDKYLQIAADLTAQLEDGGVAIDTDHFYTAGYDSPFRLRNRHNEVWILAAAAPSGGVAAA